MANISRKERVKRAVASQEAGVEVLEYEPVSE